MIVVSFLAHTHSCRLGQASVFQEKNERHIVVQTVYRYRFWCSTNGHGEIDFDNIYGNVLKGSYIIYKLFISDD